MADHLIATKDHDWDKSPRGRHPFNPNSEMQVLRLGDLSGMRRVLTNLVRIAPGKESYIPHAHAVEEEMAYILEGTGELRLGEERHPIGPGDYLGFPTDGLVHGILNTGSVPLVYLTVGERAQVEVADMPTIGKTATFRPGRITMSGPDGIEELTPEEWGARSRLHQTPDTIDPSRVDGREE